VPTAISVNFLGGSALLPIVQPRQPDYAILRLALGQEAVDNRPCKAAQTYHGSGLPPFSAMSSPNSAGSTSPSNDLRHPVETFVEIG